MKYLVLLLALLALPPNADAQSLRVWIGAGLGGSTIGISSSADITVSNGLIAGGFMGFYEFGLAQPESGGLPVLDHDRGLRGVRLGMLKSTKAYTNGIYVGLGKLSGSIPDEDSCDSTPGFGSAGGCNRKFENKRAIVVMAEFVRHLSFIGVGLKPFLIYGNSEFWPGLTVQLVVGRLR